jgi:hypothetical protein
MIYSKQIELLVLEIGFRLMCVDSADEELWEDNP